MSTLALPTTMKTLALPPPMATLVLPITCAGVCVQVDQLALSTSVRNCFTKLHHTEDITVSSNPSLVLPFIFLMSRACFALVSTCSTVSMRGRLRVSGTRIRLMPEMMAAAPKRRDGRAADIGVWKHIFKLVIARHTKPFTLSMKRKFRQTHQDGCEGCQHAAHP